MKHSFDDFHRNKYSRECIHYFRFQYSLSTNDLIQSCALSMCNCIYDSHFADVIMNSINTNSSSAQETFLIELDIIQHKRGMRDELLRHSHNCRLKSALEQIQLSRVYVLSVYTCKSASLKPLQTASAVINGNKKLLFLSFLIQSLADDEWKENLYLCQFKLMMLIHKTPKWVDWINSGWLKEDVYFYLFKK